jgi:RNA polymerase sigma factor (sigma-70 family)
MSAPESIDSFPSAEPVDDELAALVRRFDHRVRFFARRIERRFGLADVWQDDLISAGYWGLLKALRNRRPDAHEHELSAYVSRRIEGAVIDEARQLLTRSTHYAECDPSDLDTGLSHDRSESDWMLGQSLEDPEDGADRRSRWRAVEESLGALDHGNRSLLLAVASGESLAEIARGDGSSPARLQGRMTRVARQVRARAPELRRILRDEL